MFFMWLPKGNLEVANDDCAVRNILEPVTNDKSSDQGSLNQYRRTGVRTGQQFVRYNTIRTVSYRYVYRA